MAVRNVGDVRLAEERQQVVLAQRVDFDVLDDHHLPVFFAEHRRAQDLRRVEIVAVGQELQRLGDAFRRLGKPFARGILAQVLENGAIFLGDARHGLRVVLVDLLVPVHLVFRLHRRRYALVHGVLECLT